MGTKDPPPHSLGLRKNVKQNVKGSYEKYFALRSKVLKVYWVARIILTLALHYIVVFSAALSWLKRNGILLNVKLRDL